ncbi:MAG: hypothetical protein IV100_09725 [Myxococcales bacterium]|nr:hypothetical protein [Myxococcales bacterium]
MNAKRYCAVALGLTLVSCVDDPIGVTNPGALVLVRTEAAGWPRTVLRACHGSESCAPEGGGQAGLVEVLVYATLPGVNGAPECTNAILAVGAVGGTSDTELVVPGDHHAVCVGAGGVRVLVSRVVTEVNAGSSLAVVRDAPGHWRWATGGPGEVALGPEGRADLKMADGAAVEVVTRRQWRVHSNDASEPEFRRHVGLRVLDPIRGVLVQYGGRNDGYAKVATDYYDIWETDGETWRLRTPQGLGPERRGVGAWDPAGERALFVSGRRLWSLDDGHWAPIREGALPSGMPDVALDGALDGALHIDVNSGMVTLVAAGGESWRWDGVSWSETSSATQNSTHTTSLNDGAADSEIAFPTSVIEYHSDGMLSSAKRAPLETSIVAAAYDPTQGEVVGLDEEGRTWLWRDGGWFLTTVIGPGTRLGTSMTWDDSGERIVLVAGYAPSEFSEGDIETFRDTWAWKDRVWTRVETGPTTPSARYGHGMAYHPGLGVSITGGGNGESLDDHWVLDGESWSQLGPTDMRAAYHSLVSYRGALHRFGGEVNFLKNTASSSRLESDQWKQLPLDGIFAPLSRIAATPVEALGVVFAFGGDERPDKDTSGVSNRLLVLRGEQWEDLYNQGVSGPPPTSGAIAVYEEHEERVMVFRDTSDLGTWSWDARQDLRAGIVFEVELDSVRLRGQTMDAIRLSLDGVDAADSSGSAVGVDVQVWSTATSRWVAIEPEAPGAFTWRVATDGEAPIVSPVARRARFRILPAATIGAALVGPTLRVDRAVVSVSTRW